MDFSVKNLYVLNIGGVEVWITETMRSTWIIMFLLIVFAIIVRVKLKRFTDSPKGFQNFIEMLIDAFDGMFKSTTSPKLGYMGGWFFSLFALVICSNLSGLLGIRPPTADWATTFALALSTFILIQIVGMRYRGAGYLKSFFEPSPVLFPLNLIGELARPISLSFRLYGNILSGLILMTLVYGLAPVFFRFAIPSALHAYFDLFSGALQAYIFCVLSMTFVEAVSATDEP